MPMSDEERKDYWWNKWNEAGQIPPLPGSSDPVDKVTLRASDDSLWDLTATTDGTLDITAVV